MSVSAINDSLMRLEHRAERIDRATLVNTFVDDGPLFLLLQSGDHRIVYGRLPRLLGRPSYPFGRPGFRAWERRSGPAATKAIARGPDETTYEQANQEADEEVLAHGVVKRTCTAVVILFTRPPGVGTR
jgi:hypothetical protein